MTKPAKPKRCSICGRSYTGWVTTQSPSTMGIAAMIA
jgi:hypothetical protein